MDRFDKVKAERQFGISATCSSRKEGSQHSTLPPLCMHNKLVFSKYVTDWLLWFLFFCGYYFTFLLYSWLNVV